MAYPPVTIPAPLGAMYAGGQGAPGPAGAPGGGGTPGPAFSAWLNGAQTIAANTYTKALFNAEQFDTASEFDTTTGRFTPLTPGYYQFSWLATSTTAVAGISANLYKNGASIAEGTWAGPNGGAGRSGSSMLVYMNGTTDYIEVYVYIGGGTSIYGADSHQTYLTGFLARTP